MAMRWNFSAVFNRSINIYEQMKLFHHLLTFLLILIHFSTFGQRHLYNDVMPDSIASAQVRKGLNGLSSLNFLKLKFNDGMAELNYRLQLPTNKNKDKYPLIITLHNSSRMGTDNESQLEPLARIWLQPGIQKKISCLCNCSTVCQQVVQLYSGLCSSLPGF